MVDVRGGNSVSRFMIYLGVFLVAAYGLALLLYAVTSLAALPAR